MDRRVSNAITPTDSATFAVHLLLALRFCHQHQSTQFNSTTETIARNQFVLFVSFFLSAFVCSSLFFMIKTVIVLLFRLPLMNGRSTNINAIDIWQSLRTKLIRFDSKKSMRPINLVWCVCVLLPLSWHLTALSPTFSQNIHSLFLS